MRVRYSYLEQQFLEIDDLWEELREFVKTGDFTIGKPLKEFEERFAELIGVKHAIGVSSGTDALKLSMKAAGIGHGDEVITTANTFIATVGAINELGAKPVFVDCNDTFCMDVDQVEDAITERTKAIMPVHLTGYLTDMPRLMPVAEKHGLIVVEDACQGILGAIDGKNGGTWGIAGGFSLHPLKNLNVWGDGGVIVTDDDAMNEKLRLIRNHGLLNRDEIVTMGFNARLDTLQAVVGNWLIPQTRDISDKRIANAAYYDQELSKISGIRIPPRPKDMRCVYHLYMVFAEDRDGLYKHCLDNGVDCKIHYPIPLYQQEGLRFLGHKPGDFPVTDRHAKTTITFPGDEYLSKEQLDIVIETVKDYYGSG